MKFTRYETLESFGADTLDILLENEVQNNLLISFIGNEHKRDTSNWLLASVKDEAGSVLISAACTPPFNIVLYETGNKANDRAVKLLSDELKSQQVVLPGVLAEQGLARRFAGVHAGVDGFHRHLSMNIMRLDMLNDISKAPGHCRPIQESDLFFLPYWERAFSEDCRVETGDILSNIQKTKPHIGKDTHFVWENGHPVSLTFNTRNTKNGGGINCVYTPPQYRGRGYASSTVATVSRILLERGSRFCFLFADAQNPISCGIYRKLGYYDLCVFDEIAFDKL